ncbi:hypothetical protein ES288_D01G239200v1, partial [Gossypium darwinii]
LREKQKTKSKINKFCFSSQQVSRLSVSLLFFNTMDMKKISCAVIVAVAASMSEVMAAGAPSPAPASAPGAASASASASAAAPGPDSSVAISTMPVLGSLVGATLVSFFAYYLQ